MKIVAMGIWALVAAGGFGCSSKGDVDIGDDRSVSLGASLTDYAGSWEGYVEAHTFWDLTDRVRLTLDSAGNGTIELGDDKPALPAPDPDSAPPGWQLMGNSSVEAGLLVGYPYAVTGARIESKRIQLTTQTPAEYEQWCNLQTPALDPSSAETRYACLPGNGFHSDGTTCWLIPASDPEVEVPCAKFACLTSCTCTATSCTFQNRRTVDLDAALDLDGDALVGTLVLDGLRATVRLEK